MSDYGRLDHDKISAEGVNNLILKRICVIGAGAIERCLSQSLASWQADVMRTEVQDDRLALTKGQIYQSRRLNRLFTPPKESEKTPDGQISQITFKTEYQQLYDDDFGLREILH